MVVKSACPIYITCRNIVNILLVAMIVKTYIIANTTKELCMKNKAVKIGIFATILPHIFCCGLPMLLAVVGLVAPDAAHFHVLPHWLEPWLFVFSGGMLILSWYLVWRDCRCACAHCGGNKSHRTQKIVVGIITVLFFVSLLLHIASHAH